MKYKLFAVLSATVFLFTSCYRQHEKKLLAAYIDTMSLRNGDLIFREGRSVESTFVTTLDRRHNVNVFSFHKPCLLPSDVMMGNTIINTKPE